eukprot:8873282-Pyramimonas_sp.AAC.1
MERHIDPAALAVTSRAFVALDKVQSILTPLLQDCNMAPAVDYKWEADPTGKRFVISFKGAANYANRKVGQRLASFRRSDGRWENFACRDMGDKHTNLYTSMDKNPFTIERELAVRAARRVVEEACADTKFFTDKGKGALSSSWLPFLRITPTDNGDKPVVEWSADKLRKLQMSKDSLATLVEDALAGASAVPTEWSI